MGHAMCSVLQDSLFGERSDFRKIARHQDGFPQECPISCSKALSGRCMQCDHSGVATLWFVDMKLFQIGSRLSGGMR